MTGTFRGRVFKRSPVFAAIAETQLDKIPRLAAVTTFRADAPVLLAHAYYLLNDAYKERRGQRSLTDDYKKAAISAITVMALRPFEPLDPDNIETNVAYFANPIYALACANAWLSDRNLLAHYPFDYLRRFYISMLRIRMPSLAPFITAINENEDYQAIETVSLSREEVEDIEEWILKFWQLANKKR